MFFVFFSKGVPETLIEISKEKWLRERGRGRNYRYKENYIIEVNSMHGVSEYEPKECTFELFEIDLMNLSREMTQFKMKMKI